MLAAQVLQARLTQGMLAAQNLQARLTLGILAAQVLHVRIALGTLAGDDTILLVAKSASLARNLATRLKNILQGNGERPRRPIRK